MNRQAIIDRLTPKARYNSAHAPLFPLRGQYLFAATDENAGYALLSDAQGTVLPLTKDTYLDLIAEARFQGVKLRNLRVFGASGALKRAPGIRFYPIDLMAAA